MFRSFLLPCLLGVSVVGALAQSESTPPDAAQSAGFKQREPQAQDVPQNTAGSAGGFKVRQETPTDGSYQIPSGTHILLSMINSVSTKATSVGDRIYLSTAFPVMAKNRIVIPQGSWVTGTVTEIKRPGRVKGRGELKVRFDSLTLPNGVTRDFNSNLGAVDPAENETLGHEDGKITGPGNKKGDLGTVVGSTAAGTVIGSGVGAAAGNVERGAGIGVGTGAAAGLLGVLMTRGPDATLTKGSTVEMVLDRGISFSESDLNFDTAPPRAGANYVGDPSPKQQPKQSSWPTHLPIPHVPIP